MNDHGLVLEEFKKANLIISKQKLIGDRIVYDDSKLVESESIKDRLLYYLAEIKGCQKLKILTRFERVQDENKIEISLKMNQDSFWGTTSRKIKVLYTLREVHQHMGVPFPETE